MRRGAKEWQYYTWEAGSGTRRVNRDRMQYRAYRARHLFIGSGVVKCGCKQVVTRRMKITGARGGHPGAQAIIQIRVAYLNGAYRPHAQIRLAA